MLRQVNESLSYLHRLIQYEIAAKAPKAIKPSEHQKVVWKINVVVCFEQLTEASLKAFADEWTHKPEMLGRASWFKFHFNLR